MSSSASARTPAGKRVVNQDELRRLMKEKQRQSTNRKRIESPFAKYNRLGQLSCALCNSPVKSELLWQTHVLGKQHREKVAKLKGAKEGIQGPSVSVAPQSAKRKAPDADGRDAKRARAPSVPQVLPSTSALSTNCDKTGKESTRATANKPSGLGLLPDYEDDDDEEEEEGGERKAEDANEPRDAESKDHSLSSSRAAANSVLPDHCFNIKIRDTIISPTSLSSEQQDDMAPDIRAASGLPGLGKDASESCRP
ncbi:PREDICTED: zinc finger protein 830-like [Galeopterus variegatus]|uniref:Zinc finger protein 830-like n=1 Tax=Galeopterus variegatus TaxID=482537 RepID=A0ABM0QB81_GALVR|nr:PREDICTED: zinc finger protein 830-like [Galeopterus variegatus]